MSNKGKQSATPVAAPVKSVKIQRSSSFSCWAVVPLLVAASVWAINMWMAQKTYVFTLDEVASAAKLGLAAQGSCEQRMVEAVKALQKSHPNLAIPDYKDAEWIFMRAGGWMGAFKLLYASVTEYVLLFGTAIDTSGHSGRYWAVVEDTLVCGKFTQWPEGAVEPFVHGPGVTVVHERYEATGVAWTSGTWMVEHAQGFIPSTLPFAFADGILSAQDFYALWRALVVYARMVTWNALQGRF